jgi:hypothetical protein
LRYRITLTGIVTRKTTVIRLSISQGKLMSRPKAATDRTKIGSTHWRGTYLPMVFPE